MSKVSNRRSSAMTPEERENQMISLAMNEVESRIRNHTATSQELTHFLKLATVRERLELEKLRSEKEWLDSKVELAKSQKRFDELVDDAMKQMRRYNGQFEDDYDEEYEYVDE